MNLVKDKSELYRQTDAIIDKRKKANETLNGIQFNAASNAMQNQIESYHIAANDPNQGISNSDFLINLEIDNMAAKYGYPDDKVLLMKADPKVREAIKLDMHHRLYSITTGNPVPEQTRNQNLATYARDTRMSIFLNDSLY